MTIPSLAMTDCQGDALRIEAESTVADPDVIVAVTVKDHKNGEAAVWLTDDQAHRLYDFLSALFVSRMEFLCKDCEGEGFQPEHLNWVCKTCGGSGTVAGTVIADYAKAP